MSSSRPMFHSLAALFAGRAAAHHHRYLFFYLACGEVVVLAASVDPFGFSSQFVGLDNFVRCFAATISTPLDDDKFLPLSPSAVCWYRCSSQRWWSIVRGSVSIKPDACCRMPWLPPLPPLWIFLFNPGRGLITHFLAEFGYDWNHAQTAVRRCSWWCLPQWEANQLQLSVLLCRAQSIPVR